MKGGWSHDPKSNVRRLDRSAHSKPPLDISALSKGFGLLASVINKYKINMYAKID